MPDVDKLLGAIDDFESSSYCSDNDETLSRERSFAIDLYLGKNTNPAPDGRSQVVDRAVYEVVNEIKVDEHTRKWATVALERMLAIH